MKENLVVKLGSSLILGISFIIGCLIISGERADSSEKAAQAALAQVQTEAKAQAELLAKTEAQGKEVLNLQETAQLLGLEEDQVMNIIRAEHTILSQTGSFYGDMLPYLKVDEKYFSAGHPFWNGFRQ